MRRAPPDAEGPSFTGCVVALAIGAAMVAAHVVLFSALTGRPVHDPDEDGPRIAQILIAAAPFALLALAGARRLLPWLTALALTLALWGWVVFEGVRYQWNPDGSGANIGLGLIMIVSPLFIGGTALAVHLCQRRAD